MPKIREWRATPKQAEFLKATEDEVLYGGAAGGGKTTALLIACAIRCSQVPGAHVLYLRQSFPDLEMSAIRQSQALFTGTGPKYDAGRHLWKWPNGSRLRFGYLERDADVYQYQSAEFDLICFDELTQFTAWQYTYMLSRLRTTIPGVKPVVRCASNPGGIGHEWVYERFVQPCADGQVYVDPETGRTRRFIPARIQDNPHLMEADPHYMQRLAELDPVTRAQLLHGDWTAQRAGAMFRREWFGIVDIVPAGLRKVRYWDLAATEPKKGKDPDWTVGALVGERDGIWYVLDIRRVRATPMQVEALVRQTAEIDGRGVEVWMEQEPGSSGVNVIDHYRREVLKGFAFRGNKTSGSKVLRAGPLSAAAEAGNVKLLHGEWNKAFLDEAELFPEGAHDDQVDAVSGAVEVMTRYGGPFVWAKMRLEELEAERKHGTA